MMTQEHRVRLLGSVTGLVNPESAELTPDGRAIIVANAAITTLPSFRGGNGLVYRAGEAFISRLALSPAGLVMEEERLVDGLTGALGTDFLTRATTTYPAGSALTAAGGSPMTTDAVTVVPSAEARPHVAVYDPTTGEVLPPIPLWEGSALAKRFNAFEQPNGLAVDGDGNVYVTDIPNTSPDGMFATPVPSAVYRLPHGALEALAEDLPGAADAVERIEMPGWINGATVSKQDGAVWVVSCSPQCPVGGGAYRLTAEHFATGMLPEPTFRDLGGAGGILDGVGVTRRGTVVVTDPVTPRIQALTTDGRRLLLRFGGDEGLSNPADVNVCYPDALGGEPALIVPDVSARGGSNAVYLLELAGL